MVENPEVQELVPKWSPFGLRSVFVSNYYCQNGLRNGPPERIRTSDLRLRRATLYPAELRAVYV